MSATIIIRPDGDAGRALTLEDVLPEELSYGIADEFERLQEGEKGQYTMLFDPENIGRGFQIRFDGTTTELHLNYPNSRHDTELCYMMVERICKMQKVNSFEYEGGTVTLDRIEQVIQRDVDMTAYTLELYADKVRSGEAKSILLFGVINSFDVGEKEIGLFGADIDKFGEWLNKMQQMDVYYAVPHFYRKKDGSVFGSFAVKAGVESVMPLTPRIPFSMHGQFEVGSWYVMLGYSDDRKTGNGLDAVEYGALKEYIEKSQYYDAGHVVLTLSDSDVETLLAEHRTSI
jgi:hypothetical protein